MILGTALPRWVLCALLWPNHSRLLAFTATSHCSVAVLPITVQPLPLPTQFFICKSREHQPKYTSYSGRREAGPLTSRALNGRKHWSFHPDPARPDFFRRRFECSPCVPLVSPAMNLPEGGSNRDDYSTLIRQQQILPPKSTWISKISLCSLRSLVAKSFAFVQSITDVLKIRKVWWEEIKW